MTDRKDFDTEEAAAAWMYDLLDDPCNDNYRFAFEHDDAAIIRYNEQIDEGCCGKFDAEISINGQPAMIGCNYGH